MSTIQDTDLLMVERPLLTAGTNRLTLDMEGAGTTFTDTSPTPVAITAFGGATHGVPPGGAHSGTSALYLPAVNNSFLRTAANAKFATGTANFVVDAWVYLTAYSFSNGVVYGNSTATITNGFLFYITPSGYLEINTAGVGSDYHYYVGQVPLNAWTQVTLRRVGNSWAGYINGVLACSLYSTTSVTNNQASIGSWVGGIGSQKNQIKGYIDDVTLNNLTVASGTNYSVTRARTKSMVLTTQPDPLDWLMVGRGTTNYKASWAKVKSFPYTGTDLVTVDRSGTNYKCTWTDLDLLSSFTFTVNTQRVSAGNATTTVTTFGIAGTSGLIDWGDGSTTTASITTSFVVNTFSHTYATPGVYTIGYKWLVYNGSNYNILFYNSTPGPTCAGNQIVDLGPIKGVTPFYIGNSLLYNNVGAVTFDPNFLEYARPTNALRWFRGTTLSTLPAVDLSFVTAMDEFAYFNTAITSFTFTGNSQVTSLSGAFTFCSNLASISLFDTSRVTSWSSTFAFSGLTTFPAFDTSSATDLAQTWWSCTLLTSFPFINTSKVTNFLRTWSSCYLLASFQLIDTSLVTNFTEAWRDCRTLPSFPAINASSGTSFGYAWYGCQSLTSFSLITLAVATDLGFAWANCLSLTSFPLLNTSTVTNFYAAWYNCPSLASFSLIITSTGTNFGSAWSGCVSLTPFPLINTSAGTVFANTWAGCNSLTTFPDIDPSAGVNFSGAWGCPNLLIFPNLDVSAGTDFSSAWRGCQSLTSFPALTFTSGVTTFQEAWRTCLNLQNFPPNVFDNCTNAGINYSRVFENCLLTAASIENILVSWVTSGVTGRVASVDNNSGTSPSAGFSTWTPAAVTAYNTLVSRGWTIAKNA